MISTAFTWPPPFILRHSSRVRSVRLQICARLGLQLIVPNKFNPQNAAGVLQQHRAWIERTWQRIQPQSNSLSEIDSFPQQLHLQALGEVWALSYQSSDMHTIRLEIVQSSDDTKQLTLHGKTQSERLVKMVLQRWIRTRAQQCLIPWLEKISKETGLLYVRAGVRNVTTRWGSCSAKKHISLNCKLLFLPPELVEHVLIHELCHTVHMNHSRRFWDLLRSHNVNCHALRKQLKQAQKHIPALFEQ